MNQPTLYMLAGPNGAGKTTAAQYLLPEEWQCREFVNADEIARGLSPFNAEAQAMQAGRLMLERIETLMTRGQTLAFETTLATQGFTRTIARAKACGYHVSLTFLALDSPQHAIARVAKRVREGGHAIAPEVIERRFTRGLRHLFGLYLPLADSWRCYDNARALPALLAESAGGEVTVHDRVAFEQLRSKAHE